ncbi:MAG: NAD(P)H-dependent oxidoreductase [Acidimicrobiales bacterium]
MDTLVVWAHPRRGSFSEALRDTTEQALIRAGHQVQVIELYQEGFGPVMGGPEWQAYRAFRPEPDAELQRHIDALRRAEQLVFVYPTWWFGLPAMLKGWLERTMVPGVAFDFNASGQVRGALGSLQRVVGITTYGSAPWYVHLIGDAGRRTLTRALRLSTPRPWLVRSRWLALYRLDSAEDAERAAFLARVDRTLSTLRAGRR